MDRQQRRNGGGMLAGDRQFDIVVVQQGSPEHPGVDPEILAPETGLDRDFPDARRAEQQLRLVGFDQRPDLGRNALGPDSPAGG